MASHGGWLVTSRPSTPTQQRSCRLSRATKRNPVAQPPQGLREEHASSRILDKKAIQNPWLGTWKGRGREPRGSMLANSVL